MSWKIPLFNTNFDEREIEAVASIIKSGWLTMGEKTREFEQRFAEFIGVRHAIAVSSCTAALHLALLALGIGSGDEVICPSLTFVATANAIRYTGATPVFADVSSFENWNISLQSIKKVKTPRTKAILVVHYAGYACNMPAICEYAKKEGLKIVEDCAHAPGASIGGKKIGSWGDIGCFSFFSNKNISTGEGGMVVTNDDEIAKNICLMRSHGMTTLTLDRHKGHAFTYDVVKLGYNYRITEITAALGLVQLEKLDVSNKQREEIVKYYHVLLKELGGIIVPFTNHIGKSAYHIMPILLPKSINRQKVMFFLKQKGIQTSIHYRPVHTFSAYKSIVNCSLPLTEEIGKRTITLPLYPNLSYEQIKFIIENLKESLQKE